MLTIGEIAKYGNQTSSKADVGANEASFGF
jgi:hypothetical protein